jgi:hypothetical protein
MTIRRLPLSPRFLVATLCATLPLGCFSPDGGGDELIAEDTDGELGPETGDAGGEDPSPSGDPTGEPDPSAGDETTGGDEPPPDGDPTGGSEDLTPPEVVSMSPADGEAGVLVDATIVVTFSEPMDRVSTEDAFISDDVGQVAFEWNDAGDEVTITPVDYLAWSFVESPAEPALAYQYAITTAAQDQAGNALAAEYEATFTTMRGQNIMIGMDHDLSGSVNEAADVAVDVDLTPVRMGDVQQNNVYAGVVTFRFDALPEETVALAGGVFQGLQTDELGDPYQVFAGGLSMASIEYDALTPELFSAPAVTNYGVVSTGMTPALIDVDVTDEVYERFDAGEDRVQFRFRFLGASDNMSDDDRVHFWADNAVLWVTAAYP